MTREDIEEFAFMQIKDNPVIMDRRQLAKLIAGITSGCVDAALEQAAKLLPEVKCKVSERDSCIRCGVQAIRALKIGG